ncbi:MAG TPA: cupin domain-containing protein, partial [Paracoccaceae bacterium]|nr:cupin domain-containing protein [Paracoccaceae bacterium]
RSSLRHWHDGEDEFVYMLQGRVTLDEDSGRTILGPGDAAGFAAGRPNGHCLINESGAPATYLVCGTRADRDVCHYSGLDMVNSFDGVTARNTRRDGSPLPPPPADLSLPEAPATILPSGRIDLAALPELSGSDYPEPHASAMAARSWRELGDAAGLTQFGAVLYTIQPGGASSLRHWHSDEDELVWVTDGELVLVLNDGPHPLGPGRCAAFPKGLADGHHLRNRSTRPASFLAFGARATQDTCTYPDDDLVYHFDGKRAWFTRHDGTWVKG